MNTNIMKHLFIFGISCKLGTKELHKIDWIHWYMLIEWLRLHIDIGNGIIWLRCMTYYSQKQI